MGNSKNSGGYAESVRSGYDHFYLVEMRLRWMSAEEILLAQTVRIEKARSVIDRDDFNSRFSSHVVQLSSNTVGFQSEITS
jgi:hypothetical protein